MPKEQTYPYALTTLARVKDRLDIKIDDANFVLTRMINSATDYIERECGKTGLEMYPNDGHFVQKQYTNEVYSVRGASQIYLPLRNSPVTYLIVTGTLTAGNATVTGCSTTVGIQTGMTLYDIQGKFPQGTTVLSSTTNSITMTQPASSSGVQTFEVCGLIGFQWRSGTPSNPTWTPFITDQWEPEQQGHSGIVRVYGNMPRLYSNMLRATYWAGFATDWQNAGNGSTHQLPADLTDTCENLVTRIYKRRLLAGKSNEAIQGATTSWKTALDQMDLDVIAHYKRVGQIF